MLRKLLITLILIICLCESAFAQSFIYSVTLSDSNGQVLPLNTTFPLVQISLWSTKTGGAAPGYTENFPNVQVIEGIFDIIVGENVSQNLLPNLFDNEYVEIGIQVNSEASIEVLSPRVRLAAMPMAVDSHRVGGLTRAELEAQIYLASQSFGASDAVSSVLADPRVLQKNVEIDLSEVLDVIQFSVNSSIVSTKLSVVSTTGQSLFEVDSTGRVQASTYFGDGSQLSGVVSLQGSQTISGEKTFSSIDSHFLGTVHALRFVGDGADLDNVSAAFLENNIVDSSKLSSQAVTNGNLAIQAVNSNQLADFAVTTSKLANLAVSTAQIVNAAINSDKLAAQSVTSDKLSLTLTAPGVLHVTGSNSLDSFRVSTPGNSIPSLYVNSAGNVGILTNEALHALTVNGSVYADIFYGDGSQLSGVGAEITTGSVITEKIATGAVTSTKLSTNLSIQGYLSVGGALLKTDSSLALGTSSNTHVNLGWKSITGSLGQSLSYISIAGGKWNTAEASFGFIGGGRSNRISGTADMIGGGVENLIDGSYSVISGGYQNTVSGSYSSIVGGRMLKIMSDNSFGFNADSSMWTISKSSVASFMGVSMGIGTTDPFAMLDLQPNASIPALIARTSSDDAVGMLEVSTHVRIGRASSTVTTDAVLVINGNIKFNDVVRSSWPLGSSSGAFSDSGTFAYYTGSISIGAVSSPSARLEVNGDVKASKFVGDGSLMTNLSGSSLLANSITSSQLAAAAVTSGNVATGAITLTALGSSAVNTNAIAPNAVTSIAIAQNAITSLAIADMAITTSKISMGAVTSGSILNQSIITDHLAPSAVTTNAIASFSVTTQAINLFAVTTNAINFHAVTTNAIANFAVTTNAINISAVTSTALADMAVTTSKIALNSVTSGHIQSGGILDLRLGLNIVSNGAPPIQVLTSTQADLPTLMVQPHGTLGINTAAPEKAWIELLGRDSLSFSGNTLWIATSALSPVPSLVVSTNSLVGINIATPSAGLHVLESSTAPLIVSTSLSAPGFVFTSNGRLGVNYSQPPEAAVHIFESSTSPLIVSTSFFRPGFVFTSNGRLGVNTTQPLAAIHIYESSTAPLRITTNLNPNEPALVVDHEGFITIGSSPFRLTTVPTFKPFQLTVTKGSLCVDSYINCGTLNANPANGNSEGKIYAVTAAFSGADYGEYFASEEALFAADVVGINSKTGKVRRYQSGDVLLGVISTKPGVVGNARANKDNHSLVALMGQVPVNQEQVVIENGIVYTHDGLSLGSLLNDGKVYINIGSDKPESVRLRQRVETLEKQLEEMQRQMKFLLQNLQAE